MINIINNLKEIEYFGVYYLKENQSNLKIRLFYNSFVVTDLINSKEFSINDEMEIINIRQKFNELNSKSLLEMYSEITETTNVVFNPLKEKLKGKLNIKTNKNGIFNKVQMKKLFSHEDTKVIVREILTDDFAFDRGNNFSKGKEINPLEILEEILTSPSDSIYCYKYNDSIRISTSYLRNTYDVYNINMIVEKKI